MYDIKFCSHTKKQFRSELKRLQPIIAAEREKKQRDEFERQIEAAKTRAVKAGVVITP